MRDLAIKYAILTHQQQSRDPAFAGQSGASFRTLVKLFSNCQPLEAFMRFKAMLPKDVQGVLRFGFADKALCDIILSEHELVLASDPPGLAFAKASLDTESFRLAGAVTREFNLRERDLLDSLSAWLVDATRPLFKERLISESKVSSALGSIHKLMPHPIISPEEPTPVDSVSSPSVSQDPTRQMFREMLKLYADKYAQLKPDVLQQMASFSPYTPGPSAMSAFTHAMTVDALYKADAARVLFSEQSGYYHAWLHQQMFRNLIAQTVGAYIQSFAA